MGNNVVNPIQLIQMLKGGINPQQLVMGIINRSSQKNNPILQNALGLAQANNASALEMVARNLAQQRGIDFDKQFANFKNSLR